ncbi:hypothetical protein [Euzebya tangerina]|uniref:hypothetical protein n=1 Tax=Euzebya tangerina TaxID=591198 RepID=UPI0013C2EFE6|nr:hypothetical protein [Euzebya tangerina]
MSPQPILPPDLDAVRATLRPRMTEIPEILAQWPRGEGPLADVPILDPADLAPKTFTELAGTVRVAATSPDLITVAGLLEIPDGGGLLVTTMTLCPSDLSDPPDDPASRRVLGAAGAAEPGVMVEVAALISTLDPGNGIACGVGIVRPLVLADPEHFPHPDDASTYGPELRDAVGAAVADDREVVTDLGGKAMVPLEGSVARIWSPIFAVSRAATAGLARRGAAGGRPR